MANFRKVNCTTVFLHWFVKGMGYINYKINQILKYIFFKNSELNPILSKSMLKIEIHLITKKKSDKNKHFLFFFMDRVPWGRSSSRRKVFFFMFMSSIQTVYFMSQLFEIFLNRSLLLQKFWKLVNFRKVLTKWWFGFRPKKL